MASTAAASPSPRSLRRGRRGLFEALEDLDKRLASRRSSAGQVLVAGPAVVSTLVRFDPVYVVYFKTNASVATRLNCWGPSDSYPNSVGLVSATSTSPSSPCAARRTRTANRGHYYHAHRRTARSHLRYTVPASRMGAPTSRRSTAAATADGVYHD